MTEPEMKPCPFCGDSPISWGRDDKYEFIYCEACYAQGPCAPIAARTTAAELWNDRNGSGE